MISVETWTKAIPLLQQGYHLQLLRQVAELRSTRTIYPPQDRILRALETTSFPAARVVILGQDPYHGEGQAHGLAFSVPVEVAPPPSLRNIFREIQQDLYGKDSHSFSADLTSWARQGVLLLNCMRNICKVLKSPIFGSRGRWQKACYRHVLASQSLTDC